MLCLVRNGNAMAKIKEKLCFLQAEELLEHYKGLKLLELDFVAFWVRLPRLFALGHSTKRSNREII